MTETKFAFPHRSPRPLIVPWTCRTPALTAAKELATAFSVSLWACIPSLSPGIFLITSETIFSTS